MSNPTVMIVEDEFLIALDLEQTLLAAGYDVCAIVTSEEDALTQAEALRPEFAVVDVALSPGDGRIVAKALVERCGTLVLFATSQVQDIHALAGTGARACLPKPYNAADVPAALEAVVMLLRGRPPARIPNHMLTLA